MGTRARKVREDDIIELTRLLSVIVSAIVDNPDNVGIQCSNGATEILLKVEVDEHDMRFILGHHRTTYDAIRRIMQAAARARGVSIRLDL